MTHVDILEDELCRYTSTTQPRCNQELGPIEMIRVVDKEECQIAGASVGYHGINTGSHDYCIAILARQGRHQDV